MNENKSPYVAAAVMNSVMWIASAAAVGYAVKKTGNAKALWGLLIPAMGGWSVKNDSTSQHHEES